MPPSNHPKKSKDSKKPSATQPRNRNRSSTTNNSGSAVQGGGGNTNNGSRTSTNGSRRTSNSNSSTLVARSGVGGGPRRSGGVCRRVNLSDWVEGGSNGRTLTAALSDWLENTEATSPSAAGGGSNGRTLTAAGGRSRGGGGGGSGCLEEALAVPAFSDSSFSRMNWGNLSASDQRSMAEYFHYGVHSAQVLHRGSSILYDRQMEVLRLIGQEALESQAMARRSLQAVDSLTQDVEGLGVTSAQHERRLNAIEEQLAQANQQGNDTDSEGEDSEDEDSEGEDSEDEDSDA